MISIDQIQKLERKVQDVINLLGQYRDEGHQLRTRIQTYEQRIADLEGLIEQYKNEQGEIEQGIISTLEHLDNIGDATNIHNIPLASEQDSADDDRIQEITIDVEGRDIASSPEVSAEDSPSDATDDSPSNATEQLFEGGLDDDADSDIVDSDMDDADSDTAQHDDNEDDNNPNEEQLDIF